jgi:hypothetical protein
VRVAAPLLLGGLASKPAGSVRSAKDAGAMVVGIYHRRLDADVGMARRAA